MRASSRGLASLRWLAFLLFSLALVVAGVLLPLEPSFASSSSSSLSSPFYPPDSTDFLVAKTYGPEVFPYQSGTCIPHTPYGQQSPVPGSLAPGPIAYIGGFVVGSGLSQASSLDAGAPYQPCFYTDGSDFWVGLSVFVSSGPEFSNRNSGLGTYAPSFASFEVTTLGLSGIASSWQGYLCVATPSGPSPGCSSVDPPVGAISDSALFDNTYESPCPQSDIPSSYTCNTFWQKGAGDLTSLPSGVFVICFNSLAQTDLAGSLGYEPDGYACAVYGYGAEATPLDLSCSVAANPSNGVVNFDYSDGGHYGWTASVTASASGASPSSGSGGDSGVFTSVLPVTASVSQMEVVWSDGSTFEGACEKSVDFFPSNLGGRSGGAGPGVPSGAPPGSFDFSACAPSGFGWVDPIALLKGFGCLLQGLFVPTGPDLSSLYSMIQVSPFMSAIAGAPTRVTAAATSWSPVFSFGSVPSVLGSPSSSLGTMTVPSISADGWIATVVDCIVGVVDLVLLISVFA